MRAWNAVNGGRMLAVLLSLAIATGVVVTCLSGFRLSFLIINADALYLPTLFRDLFELHGRWSAWYLTPAPYIFPDYLLFLPAYLLGKSAFHQVLIYALLQLGLMTAAVWLLAKRSGCRAAYWPAVLASAVIAYLAISLGQPYVFVLMSAFHFSIFLFAIWLVAQVAATGPGGSLPGGMRLWLACVFSFLLALSDALVMVQVIVPVAISLLLRNWARELDLRSALRWSIPLGMSGLAGILAYPFVVAHGTRPASGLNLSTVMPKLEGGWKLILLEFSDSPVLMSGLAVFYGFAAYCLLMQLARRQVRVPLPVVTLSSLALVAGLINIAATLALANVDVTPRYFIPPACWPIVVAALWLGLWMSHRPWVLALPVTVAVGGLGMAAAVGVERYGFQQDFYPADVACIDAALDGTGLTNGLTQYWDAKRIGAFSKHDLRLAQYLEKFTEFRWITSERHYREAYDFAIVTDDVDSPAHRLNAQALQALAGPAQRTVTCGNRTLLIYGHDGLRLTTGAAK